MEYMLKFDLHRLPDRQELEGFLHEALLKIFIKDRSQDQDALIAAGKESLKDTIEVTPNLPAWPEDRMYRKVSERVIEEFGEGDRNEDD